MPGHMLSQVYHQEAGSEVDHPGLELVYIWEDNIICGGLVCDTTTLAMIISCSKLITIKVILPKSLRAVLASLLPRWRAICFVFFPLPLKKKKIAEPRPIDLILETVEVLPLYYGTL